MYLYKTIFEYGEAEYTIQRSRFIAHASPADTPEEARVFVSEIKEKYRDATHNVPAFVCGAGSEHQWASDDGEPAGTSGMPVLKLITGAELTDIVLVVTRYFGGIKLGTGGLARAYTHAAGLAIEAAGICEVRESVIMQYYLDYSQLNRLQSMASDGILDIRNITYTDKVSAEISCAAEAEHRVMALIADLSGGRAQLLDKRSAAVKHLL